MEVLGWLVLVIIAIALTVASFFWLVGGSMFSNRISPEFLFPGAFAALFWFLAWYNYPFLPMVLKSSVQVVIP